MTGLTYPYTKYDRILGDNLADDLELNPKTTPPSGTAGGAGRYKWWADTTNPLGASLRQAVAERATAGFYVAAEWLTWGTIDIAARKFHFNTDGVDFTEGTGPLIVHDLSVTNTLAVGGASTLHNTSITGDLSVSGGTTLSVLHTTGNVDIDGSLNVDGGTALRGITGTSLELSGNLHAVDAQFTGLLTTGSFHSLGAADIDGALNVDGTSTLRAITGTSLELSGNLHAVDAQFTGLLTTGSLHVLTTSDFDGGVNIDGGLTVAGNANIGGILTADSASITHGLTVGGNLHVLGNSDFDGTVNIDGDLTAHHIIADTITLTSTPDADIHTRDIFARNITTTGDVVVGHNFQVVGECLPLVVGNTRIGVNGVSYQTFDTRTDPTFGFRLTAFDLAFSIQPTGTGGGYPNLDVWFNNSYVFTINAFYSDPRTKTNIQPSSTDALSLIRQVQTFEYDQYGNHIELGVMGDQLGPLIPNSIMTGPSANTTIPDLMQVNVATMITYMLKSIQQLDSEVGTGIKVTSFNTRSGDVVLTAADVTSAGGALLAGPAFSGVPTAPTAARATATTQLATTAFVRTGTNTNDDAPAGQIGEYQTAQLLSTAAIAITTGVDTVVVSLPLTAGDWEVVGSAGFTNTNNPNNMALRAWINATGASTAPPVDQFGGNNLQNIPNVQGQTILPLSQMRVSLSAGTTIRMGVTVTGGGNVNAWGKIMARRVR